MESSDEERGRKASLQRGLRIALGLFIFALGAFMAAAVVVGFDASHTGWQDYLIFLLPVPWLVVSVVIFAYRPGPHAKTQAKADQSTASFFQGAIGIAIFGGFLKLLWAFDWGETIHTLLATAGAVLILFLLSLCFKEPSKRLPADADRSNP